MNRRTRDVYDPAFYEPLVKVEDHHFWFRARNRVIGELVAQLAAQLSPGYRMLEVGCRMLHALAEACSGGAVVGMNLFADGLQYARARMPNALLVRGDVSHPPFAERFEASSFRCCGSAVAWLEAIRSIGLK